MQMLNRFRRPQVAAPAPTPEPPMPVVTMTDVVAFGKLERDRTEQLGRVAELRLRRQSVVARLAQVPRPNDIQHLPDVDRELAQAEAWLARIDAEWDRAQQAKRPELEATVEKLETELLQRRTKRDAIVAALQAPDADTQRLAPHVAEAERKVEAVAAQLEDAKRLLGLARGRDAALVAPEAWRARKAALEADLEAVRSQIGSVQELCHSPAVAADPAAVSNLTQRLSGLQAQEDAAKSALAAIAALEARLQRRQFDPAARLAIEAVSPALATLAQVVGEVAEPLKTVRERLQSVSQSVGLAARARNIRTDDLTTLGASFQALHQAEAALAELGRQLKIVAPSEQLLPTFDAGTVRFDG